MVVSHTTVRKCLITFEVLAVKVC